MNSYLSMHNVSKSYCVDAQTVQVFDNTSIRFEQGHAYAVMGASGSGKSTMIHLLAGVDMPTAGTIDYNDQIIASFSAEESAAFLQKNISLVFQQPLLFAELTVLENIMVKAILAHQVTSQSRQKAMELLHEVGLADKADAYPAMLSGGQQQRVALLRAIFIVPEFLLVDEPTGNLDEDSSKQVIDLLLYYQKKYKMGLIVSTHNQSIAQRMQTVVRVENKKLIQQIV